MSEEGATPSVGIVESTPDEVSPTIPQTPHIASSLEKSGLTITPLSQSSDSMTSSTKSETFVKTDNQLSDAVPLSARNGIFSSDGALSAKNGGLPPDSVKTSEFVSSSAKTGGLTIQPVSLSSSQADETSKVVPGIKIIGLSSELNKEIVPIDKDEEEIEEEEDDDGEEESEEEEDSEEEEEEDEEEDVEPPAMIVKPPKGIKRNVMQVSTPGVGYKVDTPDLSSSTKKRGRPSRAALALREVERQEAIARGEPDPELKRKKRKPLKLIDGDEESSEQEESLGEKKRRKKEEREERKRRKKESEDTEDTEEEKVPKKRGRQKKILTEEEMAEREAHRKRKYQEARDKAKAKVEQRKAYLMRKRDERKQQKVLEKKKHEEHLRRMAELRSQYLDDNATDGSPATPGGNQDFLMDENSQSSLGSLSLQTTQKKRKAWSDVGMAEMSHSHNPLVNVSADTLFEYKWPLEGRNSEHYFLQEQVSEFLGVKSFKRKYPDCARRVINMEERDFLIEMKIVNETQADLGLTAIPSGSVLDIMCQDFYEKYDAYMAVVSERKERSIRNFNYSTGGGNVKVEEAAKQAAEYNKRLNADRKNQRTAYFDMQTFCVHYPKTNKGRMKVITRPSPGNYPVAMIPGQFVDSYKVYNATELKYFPLNTVTTAPPKSGFTTRDLNLGSEGNSGDSDSGSSSSSSGSDSDSDSDSADSDSDKKTKPETTTPAKKETDLTKEESKDGLKSEPIDEKVSPKKKVDEIRPGATCKHCAGDINKNKLGVPELLLHCTKCDKSSHPTCVGLHLDLLQYVTNYDWECTDCKKCMKCNDPADEDKMLFCDLCDRGFHIYCVGLDGIPNGRWQCENCNECVSCGCKTPAGDGSLEPISTSADLKWAYETKTSMKGEKIYSHTMCQPCHKQWKKGSYCPECNGVFGAGNKKKVTSDCWVCARTHHAACVGLDKANARFICSACQRRTQEKTIAGGRQDTPARPMGGQANSFNRTPATTASYSRSGRRVTQINFSNQF